MVLDDVVELNQVPALAILLQFYPNQKKGIKRQRERTFEVALKLFSTKGFNGVSIRDLTKTVGINESSLYNHFDGKEDFEDLIESTPLEAMFYERKSRKNHFRFILQGTTGSF